MKVSPRSPLASLSEQDQAKLVSWLDLHRTEDVIAMVAAPPPEGFGIETHITTLRRFYVRYQNQHRKEDSDLAAEIVTSMEPYRRQFHQATLTTIEKIAFDLATSPKPRITQFKALSRWLTKMADQDQKLHCLELARERLNLEKMKFEFNSARAALMHLVPLQEIAENKSLDDEDKIRAARKQIFGDSAPDK